MTAARTNAGAAQIAECGRILVERAGFLPRVHLVLGSGLGGLAARVHDHVTVPFGDLPGFPDTSVESHAGEFVLGHIAGVPVVVQSGRFHVYEGHGSGIVLAPVRTGRAAGARIVVLTNAAGGIRSDLVPGSLMLVDDHLNAMFRAPLAGPAHEHEDRFPDMSRPYDPVLMSLAEAAALEAGIALPRGVYGAVHGPSFETPAEVRALRTAGADAVGMSTVPEVLAARAGGQRALAISAITNRASGLGLQPVDHTAVMSYASSAGRTLASLLETLLPSIATSVK